MALFMKGRAKHTNSANHASPARNGRAGRGKERGSGRAYSDTRTRFSSTRLETQLAPKLEDDTSTANSDKDKDIEEVLSESSSESDYSTAADAILPYAALFQSLAGGRRSSPQRKKRKLDATDVPFLVQEPQMVIYDEVEEPEEEGDLVADAVDSGEHEHKHEHEHQRDQEQAQKQEQEEEQEEVQDPYAEHLDPDSEILEQRIKFLKEDQWSTKKCTPQLNWSRVLKVPNGANVIPEGDTEIFLDAESLRLKQKLRQPARNQLPAFDKLFGDLSASLFQYRDILFSHRTLENNNVLRKLTCLHALNHVLKTRDRIIKNNARLAKEDVKEDVALRALCDQGFTRPKVLILLPTRHSCVKYVETLTSLCEPEQQENKKRFQDSYATGQRVSSDKPPDFRELFDGNDDDAFRIGLKFTRKTIKFFANFYNSDIILASPLGLRMALGGNDAKKQDSDFLTSIEILIMDQAESLLMQNWEHVEYIFDRLNLQPKGFHGCDFSRVREWYLDGDAKYLRQTILLSAFNFPSLNKIYMQRMLNIAGKVKYSKDTDGSMINLATPMQQRFSRLDFITPATEPDDRFEYFVRAVLPSLMISHRPGVTGGQGVLIYLPSYAAFVRVRNYLAASSGAQNISFGSISEYTSAKDVARARSHFLSGRHSVLLYTERAHHFRRYNLKGVKRIIMYGLPENPIFYNELVGGFLASKMATAESNVWDPSVRVIFSKLDIMKLERIVGSTRYLSILNQKNGDTFEFL